MDAEKINADAELTRDYSAGQLFLFVLPSIFTFVFIAVYQIVDGMFISRYAGPYAIAAVNLYYPVISLLLAAGMMMGTGCNAVTVELLGRGEREEANRIFSQTLITTFVISAVLAVPGLLFAEPLMKLLGASEANIDYLRPYYRILTAAAPAVMFQTILGILIIGEGKSTLTGILIIIGGVLNIILDYIFMGPLKMGTPGAAIATVIGYAVPVLYAFRFYSPAGKSKYRFRLCRPEPRKLLMLMFNGSSEMVSNLAAGVTALFMNRIAFRLCGDVGVSVVSVYLYVQFIIMAIFMGIAAAVEPLFSYHYGSGNTEMIRRIFRRSLILVGACSAAVTAAVWLLHGQIAGVFFASEGNSAPFRQMAEASILFTVPAALVVGFNIFASGLFTAFSNGAVSAMLSIVRTFVLFTACIYALSAMFGEAGLWSSWGAAEILSLILSAAMILKYRKRYLDGPNIGKE